MCSCVFVLFSVASFVFVSFFSLVHLSLLLLDTCVCVFVYGVLCSVCARLTKRANSRSEEEQKGSRNEVKIKKQRSTNLWTSYFIIIHTHVFRYFIWKKFHSSPPPIHRSICSLFIYVYVCACGFLTTTTTTHTHTLNI